MYRATNSKGVLNPASVDISMLERIALPYMSATAIAEGTLMHYNATTGLGEAAAAGATENLVYLTAGPSTEMTSYDNQEQVIDSEVASVMLKAGGIPCYVGKGEEFDLILSSWDVATAPVVNYYVTVGASGKLLATAAAGMTNVWQFGKITKIVGNRVYFRFSSLGTYHTGAY